MAIYREDAGKAALKAARQFTGLPYIYGVHDCSWTTETAYGDVGIIIARTTEVQYAEWPIGPKVPYEVGDLIFIAGDPIDANPGHVMMFVKPGWVFEAEETGTLIGEKPYDTSVFEFRTRPSLALPTLKMCQRHNLVRATAAQVKVAERNGYAARYWNGEAFPTKPKFPLTTTTRYVPKNYRDKRR